MTSLMGHSLRMNEHVEEPIAPVEEVSDEDAEPQTEEVTPDDELCATDETEVGGDVDVARPIDDAQAEVEPVGMPQGDEPPAERKSARVVHGVRRPCQCATGRSTPAFEIKGLREPGADAYRTRP